MIGSCLHPVCVSLPADTPQTELARRAGPAHPGVIREQMLSAFLLLLTAAGEDGGGGSVAAQNADDGSGSVAKQSIYISDFALI